MLVNLSPTEMKLLLSRLQGCDETDARLYQKLWRELEYNKLRKEALNR